MTAAHFRLVVANIALVITAFFDAYAPRATPREDWLTVLLSSPTYFIACFSKNSHIMSFAEIFMVDLPSGHYRGWACRL